MNRLFAKYPERKKTTMKEKHANSKKIVSLLLALTMLLGILPFNILASAAERSNYNRIVDENTMDGWKNYFDLRDGHLDTSNAGGVWTDKSVFSDASAFANAGITMKDPEKNFLTALSAIAANKEIVGYSYIPTDTVLILDVSGSMNGSETDLVNAANKAVGDLLKLNRNNRVGVVLYSGDGGGAKYDDSVTRLLAVDRYTTSLDGKYLNFSNGRVSVNSNVKIEGTNTAPARASKEVVGGTYIQAGLWEAMEMFLEKDVVIQEENWQKGELRMPITVLMSDGAPTNGTSQFDDVKNSEYTTVERKEVWVAADGTIYYNRNDIPNGVRTERQRINVTTSTKGSNVGNGNQTGITAGQGFLTQLTAAYIKNRIENHYKSNDDKTKSLFYTLGFNISPDNDREIEPDDIAYSVMNPDGSKITDALWNSYNGLTGNQTLNVAVKGRGGSQTEVSISKSPYATSKSYVDEYFSASDNGLSDAFQSIVDEIILQSRYYPTHLEGGNPDFSGYIEFTDRLGKYMEIKDIKGIVLGDRLFDGRMLASGLTEINLGTPEAPTAMGNEYIQSIKTRLEIKEDAEAHALVSNAWNSKQFYYNAQTGEWSNYIGWYAKADGGYIGHWKNSDKAADYPQNAAYIIRSYGFLGETTGSIKNSDMMYMTVQVRTNIETGEQSVIWKIPASLVPMITYNVSLEGKNIDSAKNVRISVDDNVSPIRLVFESGLRSDINIYNITEMVQDSEHITNGHTRQFWTNFFDISAASHDNHITATAEFMPSEENERFYYTFDSAIFQKNGNSYSFVEKQANGLNPSGEYYHRRYIFTDDSTNPVFVYEKINSETITLAKWEDNFHIVDGQTMGAYYIPKGTVTRELEMYNRQKDVNNTKSAHMVFHPYIAIHNETAYVDMNLGNNGLLEVTPAQGLKISKTIDIIEEGTELDFDFRITVLDADGDALSESYDGYITEIGKTPTGNATPITLSNGIADIEIAAGETFWLIGLPEGATYTVEEIDDNADYKLKSIHVNGTPAANKAVGDIAQYYIDNIQFENTAVGEGDLVVTKQVVDKEGNIVDVNNNISFTAEISLENNKGEPVSGTFASSIGNITFTNGKAEVTLSDGASIVIRDIPEETVYTVSEKNIPNGFSLNAQKSVLSGVVDHSANDEAIIVNTYAPTSTTGEPVDIVITKTISGNRTEWNNGESYSFVIEALNFSRDTMATEIARGTIKYSDAQKKFEHKLSSETYAEAGTYVYKITETVGNIGGITYDTAERRFEVVVADSDMDGDLEIIAVNNLANTRVSGTYVVSADFNNVYAPTGTATVEINIQKAIKDAVSYPLAGFEFGLFDAQDNKLNTTPIITDANGKAKIPLTFAANRTGVTYTYYVAEIEGNDPNMNYSTEMYKVEISVADNLDGTIKAETRMIKVDENGEEEGNEVNTLSFTNEYVPSESVKVNISGNKTITDNRAMGTGEFKFKIEALTNGAPMPASTTTSNASNGAFVFDTIEFTEAGTYEYKVTEVKGNNKGMTYDSSEKTVTVTVTDLAVTTGERRLVASVKVDGDANKSLSFHNIYQPGAETLTLNANKVLVGKKMAADEFEFELKALTNGAPMPANSIAKNGADGKIIFDAITYTEAGIYSYTLSEKATNDTHYDFDKSVYTVTVTVTDDGEGTLTFKTDILKNDTPATALHFTNVYVPDAIEYDIYADFGGEKVLEGRELEADEFSFILKNTATGELIQTVKNAKDGTVKFDKVKLHEIGKYQFRIEEELGTKGGIAYDRAVYYVVIEVMQRDDGSLYVADTTKKLYIATVSQKDADGTLTEVTEYTDITANGKIEFKNTYSSQEVSLTVIAEKKLAGRDLVNGEFKFLLKDEEGNVVANASNTQDGKIIFESVALTKAGIYKFTACEEIGTDTNVTYDETLYVIEITVTDDGNGHLVAEKPTIKKNGAETVNDVIFENTYTPKAPPTPPAPPEEPEAPKPPLSPETGDNTSLGMRFVLLFVSGGAVITFAALSRKRKVEIEE